jgi:hypothetical protein
MPSFELCLLVGLAGIIDLPNETAPDVDISQ